MSVVEIRLPHLYRARFYQRDSWDALLGRGRHKGKKYRLFVKVWHRRGGKDVTDVNQAITVTAQKAMTAKYGFPTNDMARDNMWESYTNDGLRMTDYVPMSLRVKAHSKDDGLNDSLKSIKFRTGGSLRFISTHRPERLRGGNSKLFGLSEFQMMDPRCIDIIMPILRMNGGQALINMTANGDSAAKVLLEYWKTQEDVYVSELSVEDTGLLTQKDMDDVFEEAIAMFRARGQSEEEAIAFVRQEYYCDWSAPVIGSYFGAGMKFAADDGRITRVPYESSLPVYTFWDLGVDDSMSIWFAQFVGREIRLIDYYENSGEGFNHYSKVLKGQIEGFERMREYSYGHNNRSTHYGPHDLAVRNLGKEAQTRVEVAKSSGIDFNKVKRVTAKEDGIEAIRTMLSRCYFDEVKCKRGISALKGYKKEYNEKLQVYYDKPVHDWTSHGTDAFQTLATSELIKNPQQNNKGGRVIKSSGGILRQPATLVLPNGQVVLNMDPRKAALHAARKRSSTLR
jgi:phage terminase large subunit